MALACDGHEIVACHLAENLRIGTGGFNHNDFHFHAGLVRLRYSPLALDYVDANRPVEAGYAPGLLSEEAALKVVITGWDDSRWATHSRLTIDAEVHVLDGVTGASIWGGHVSRRVDVTKDIPRSALNRTLLSRALDQFVGDVLASLPPRDPRR